MCYDKQEDDLEVNALFTKQTLDFLFENRLHDSKAWFEEHKEDYNRLVLKPLQELVVALTPSMLEMDGNFTTEPRVDKTICRIRRDTRYSRDKSLYRDVMWIIFKEGKMHGTEVPGVYFEINGGGFTYGCGFYNASTSYMNTMRELILEGDKTFKKAKKVYESQSVFHLEGEKFKRPHYPDQPPELQDWLDLRGISFVAESKDFDLLFSERLSEKLIADYKLMTPLYNFLLHTASLERQSQTANQLLQY